MNPCLAVLQEKLEAAGAEYEVEEHPLAFTAQRVAAAEHVSGHQFAKPVVVMADERPCLVVLPASRNLDLEALRAHVGAKEARLARESEFVDLFPDCEVGAMPPFPGPNEVPVYVDSGLLAAERIAFEAGSHTESVRMKTEDYLKLASPNIGEFAQRAAGAPRTEWPNPDLREDGGWLFPAVAAAMSAAAGLAVLRLILRRLLPGPVTRALVAGAAVGAAAVALADPRSGRRRRAMVRDKGLRYARLGLRKGRATTARLAGKAKGAQHRAERLGGSRTKQD